jgi:hypothetical protein
VPGGAGTIGDKLLTSTSAAAGISATLARQASDVVAVAFTTDPGQINFSDWGTGGYTVELNVTAVGGQVFGYKAQLVRVNSACGAVATLGTSATQTGIGQKTFTFTNINSNGASSDRLQVRILATAGNGGDAARTMTVQVNTSDSEVRAPFIAPSPTPTAALGPASAITSLSVAGAVSGTDPMLQCDMDAMRSDVTGDGYWNSNDVAVVVGLFGQAVETGTRADIHPSTPDGFVDISDLAMIAGRIGPSSPIASS